MDQPLRATEAGGEAPAIEVDGERWKVRSLGATRSGTRPDQGAPLLLIGFVRNGAAGEQIREAVAVAKSLEDLSLDELKDLFDRSAVQEKTPGRESEASRKR